MKKMVLVPEGLVDTLVRKDEAASTPELDALVRLGKEMEHLRERRDIPLEEKVVRYKEALRKYLHFQEEFHSHSEPSKAQPSFQLHAQSPEPMPVEKPQGDIIASIPETYRKDARKLLHMLENVISYDNGTKEIIYKGNRVPGSSIVDLLHDTVSKTKKAPPIGIEVFRKAMEDANVPHTLRKNPNRFPKAPKLQLTDDEEDATWLPLK